MLNEEEEKKEELDLDRHGSAVGGGMKCELGFVGGRGANLCG
jgi:hypothetical protein